MTEECIRMLIGKLDSSDIVAIGILFLLWSTLNGIRKPIQNINRELGELISAIRELKSPK